MDENELEDLAYELITVDDETMEQIVESLSEWEFEVVTRYMEEIIRKWSK